MAPPVRLHGHRVLVKVLRPGSAAHRARAVVRQALEAAGVDAEQASDAEIAVAELAANAETHAREPYELRIISMAGAPAWCEVVDGDMDLIDVLAILSELRSGEPTALWFREAGDGLVDESEHGFRESGRGLLMVHQLSGGRCAAYPTRTFTTGIPGKAVGFALPAKDDPRRLDFPPPVPDLREITEVPRQVGIGIGSHSSVPTLTGR
ncbi:ATP-binding protein [Sphaerimonospora sp. CA-214678]|uniref:ATP-binding protein n=1 Tax=Sphaerimonospora sp. CA-214678 TaxID=3240029 RepID=UPI003D8AA625